MNRTPRRIVFLQVHFDNQYFTKFKIIPENWGAGVRPLPYFQASTSYFVIY
jgi:hypothetical protein